MYDSPCFCPIESVLKNNNAKAYKFGFDIVLGKSERNVQ